MLMSLWMMAQFVLLALSIVLGSQLAESPVQALLLVIAGALVLTPLLPIVIRTLVRALASASDAPPKAAPARSVRSYRMPSDPGIPGSALARAPSRLVHASA